ncbi:MAG: sulfatase-like hydrolase/transferase [Polyangiaceae bacterium]
MGTPPPEQEETPGSPSKGAGGRLRTALARGRWALFPLFCLQFVLLDLVLRRARAFEHLRGSSWATLAALHSAALWLVLALSVRKSAVGRSFVGLLAGAAVAFQVLFFARFGRFADRFVARSALLSWEDIAPAFTAELPRLIAVAVIAGVIEAFWLRACTLPVIRVRRVLPLAALLVLAVPLTASPKAPPDLRLLDVTTLVPVASPERAAVAQTSLPVVKSPRAALPNVVLVITESVRADEYCSSPVDDCPTAPQVNSLFPERVGFSNMRSTASFTVVSMSALVTGRGQNIPRRELLSSPTLFDIARSLETAGDKVYTAYWSAHHAPMFHWEDPKRSVDSYVTFDTLFEQEGKSRIADVRLAQMFQERLASLPSPFFVVLHFHDTHILYAFDEDDAPFQPWTRDVSWETMPRLRNAYRNAIHAQDRSIAASLRALKSDPRWADTFVFFTSDHGEAFGEHSSIHHGQNILDEQVRVPAFAAFGESVLSREEEESLRAASGAFVTHLDVAPTVLDLYGVWTAPELFTHVSKMQGRSLLRPLSRPGRVVPMTNCSETFPCPFNNWGLLRGDTKLEAQAWDAGWTCWKLTPNGEIKAREGDPDCESLEEESRTEHPLLPSGAPNE